MSLRRRRIAAIALVATAPFVLSACGTSFGAQTNQQYQASVGANLRDLDSPVQIYNGLLVDNEDGTATFSGALLARGDEDQQIESVEITASDSDTNATPAGTPTTVELGEPLQLPAETLVPVGADGEIIVEDDQIEAGGYALITLELASGEQVSLNIPVVVRTSMYDSIAGQSAPRGDAYEAESPEGEAPEGEAEAADGETPPATEAPVDQTLQ